MTGLARWSFLAFLVHEDFAVFDEDVDVREDGDAQAGESVGETAL